MKFSCTRRSPSLIALLILLASLTACDKPVTSTSPTTAKPVVPTPTQAGIAWREGDIEDAFAEAKESGKPILLYWGTVWCPPCNRLQATLFKDPAFIDHMRGFVAVHLDGDLVDGQVWGERFGVEFFPTIIILRPDRSEITRLAGEADNARLIDIVNAAKSGTTTPSELLDRALHSPKRLNDDEWVMLANYPWAQGNRLIAPKEVPDTLVRLARAAPKPALQHRFALTALVQGDVPPAVGPVNQLLLEAILANPAEVRDNIGALSNYAGRLINASSKDPTARAALSARLDSALDNAYADAGLPAVNRLATTTGKIQLARLAQAQPIGSQPKDGKPPPPLPQAIVDTVQQRVDWALTTAKTDEERQAIVTKTVELLDEVNNKAGLEQLLLAELGRTKTPQYYMQFLAYLAEERGDGESALLWLKKAYGLAQGNVSRLRWGSMYADGLVRLRPDDTAAIESAVTQLADELAGQPEGYLKRAHYYLDKLGASLKKWNAQGPRQRSAVLARLRDTVKAKCGSASTQACAGWLS